MEFTKSSTALLVNNFELETTEDVLQEEELLHLLADRIAWMIDYRMEFLLSTMYRLDVLEHKINFALSPMAQDPPALGLAKLIIERQKQKLETRQKYSSKPPENEEDDCEW